MARPGFSLDRKFKRLARSLDDVQPGFGEILARGSLELLWDSAYEACDDYLGDSEDVEALAHWGGKGGTLTAALLGAGGEDRSGFIEEGGGASWPEGKPGTFRVHDLYDHAPDYVQKRLAREAQREAKGKSITDLRREAGKKGAAVTHGKRTANVEQPSGKRLASGVRLPGNSEQTSAAETASGGRRAADVGQFARTPSPAPAPTPAPQEAAAAAREDAPASLPESPGPEEETGPVESDAAQANAVAPRGSAPAARDGGEAAAAGIAAETRGAPGPARPSAAPVDDDPPPRRLEVVDEGRGAPTPYLWPRAAAFRQALTDRMARTVLFPIGGQEPKVMSSLEASLALIPEAEAVELCRERILAAHSANRRGGGTLSYFAQVLADEAMRRQTNAETAPKRKRVVGVDALGQPIFEVQA